MDDLWRVMRKKNIYIWCNKEQIPMYLDYFVKGKGLNFEFLIWHKGNVPPFYGSHYLKDKEYCLYFWEAGGIVGMDTYDKGRTVYESYTNKKDKEDFAHPTIKPLEFVKTLICNSTNPGDLVFDPFMGSGTTAVAAKTSGRRYYGFEIYPKYHQIAVLRAAGASSVEIDGSSVKASQQGSLFDYMDGNI